MSDLREAAQQALEARYRYGWSLEADAALEALRAALEQPMQCKKCTAYFEKFSCGKENFGECDCPKCQGYCECN